MKPATAKAKGRMVENQAVEWLRANGWPHAERRRLAGAEDMGDVSGVLGVTIEVKSAAAWKPAQWLKETRVEMVNSGDDVGFAMCRNTAADQFFLLAGLICEPAINIIHFALCGRSQSAKHCSGVVDVLSPVPRLAAGFHQGPSEEPG